MIPLSNLDKLIASKNIGFFAALCLIFNQVTGPGIPTAPADFQNPGWVMASFGYIVFAVLGAFSSLYLIEAIQAVPGNRFFQGRIEYATLINFYFGYYSHIFGQFLLYGAIQSIAIQCIIFTSQSTDNIIALLFGQTCGFTYEGTWLCAPPNTTSQTSSPFGDIMILFSIGFLIVMGLSFLLGVANFEGNISINMVTFIITMILAIQWISAGFITGVNPSQVPAVADISPAYGEFFGTVMLNMGIVLVIPSWINVKSRQVSVQKVVWTVAAFAACFFIVLGMCLAYGVQMEKSRNVLDDLLLHGVPPVLTRITVCLFSYAMLLPSVPVSFIISRENLVHNNVLSKPVATFLTFVLPWILALPLQTRSYVYYFQAWTSLVFMSTTNFILPFILYLKCDAFRKAYNSDRLLSRHQLKVLQNIHSDSVLIRQYIAKKSRKMSTSGRGRDDPEGVEDENDTRTNSDVDMYQDGEHTAFPLQPVPPVIVVTRATDIPSGDDEDVDGLESNPKTTPSHLASESPNLLCTNLLEPGEISANEDSHSNSSHSDFQDRKSYISFKPNSSPNAKYIDPRESGLPLGVIEQDVPDPDHDIYSFSSYSRSRAHTPSSLENFGVHDDRFPMQALRRSFEFDVLPEERGRSSHSLGKGLAVRRSGSRSPSNRLPRISVPDTLVISPEGDVLDQQSLDEHGETSEAVLSGLEDGIPSRISLVPPKLDIPVHDSTPHLQDNGSPSPSVLSIASGRPSDLTRISGHSFPRDPEFFCPAFRVVPVWMPINEHFLAYVCLCFSILMTAFGISWTIIDHIYETAYEIKNG